MKQCERPSVRHLRPHVSLGAIKQSLATGSFQRFLFPLFFFLFTLSNSAVVADSILRVGLRLWIMYRDCVGCGVVQSVTTPSVTGCNLISNGGRLSCRMHILLIFAGPSCITLMFVTGCFPYISMISSIVMHAVQIFVTYNNTPLSDNLICSCVFY